MWSHLHITNLPSPLFPSLDWTHNGRADGSHGQFTPEYIFLYILYSILVLCVLHIMLYILLIKKMIVEIFLVPEAVGGLIYLSNHFVFSDILWLLCFCEPFNKETKKEIWQDRSFLCMQSKHGFDLVTRRVKIYIMAIVIQTISL